MPEREITEEQSRAIKTWIYETKRGVFKRNLLPGMGNGVWTVDGEPIVIDQDDSGKLVLNDSDKHDQELVDLEIIPEVAVTKTQLDELNRMVAGTD